MASSFTPTAIISGVLLPGSVQKLYTVPVLSSVQITQLAVNNTDTVSHAVSVYLSSTADYNVASLVWKGTLAPGQSYPVYQAVGQTLGAGSTIQAGADLDSVVAVRASGILIQ